MSFLNTVRALSTALAISFLPATSYASLISNGGFETGDISGWNYNGTVGANLFVDPAYAHSGSFGVGIGPNGFIASLSQSFSTNIGDVYTLDFWLALDPPGGNGTPNSFSVSVDGFATSLLAMTDAAPFSFTHYAYSFTATQAATTLAFAVRNDPWGFSIDDVAVNPSAIPEPATLALMALGLAGMGWKSRRKAS